MEESMQNITEEKILEAINRLEERRELDFKESINFEGVKKVKAELTKDIIAMANAGGGLIIGGVKESGTGFEKCGMPGEELRVFDSTKLNQFANNYCDPPINATTRIVKEDTMSFGVIIVPGFGGQPHIVKKNFPEVLCEGDVLIRTSNNESRRAGANEVRELIDHSITRRQGVMQKMLQSVIPSLESKTTELMNNIDTDIPFDVREALEKYKGFRIIKMTPIGDIPMTKLFTIGRNVTESVIRDNHTGDHSFPQVIPEWSNEIRLPIGLFLQEENDYIQYMRASFFGANGLVYCSASLWEDQPGGQHTNGLGVISCIKNIFESLLFLVQYYRKLNWAGNVIYEFSVESSIPRQLVMESGRYMPFFRNYQNSMSIPISVKRKINTNLGVEEIERLTVDLMMEYFWFYQWDVEEGQIQSFLDYIKEKYTLIPKFFNGKVEN